MPRAPKGWARSVPAARPERHNLGMGHDMIDTSGIAAAIAAAGAAQDRRRPEGWVQSPDNNQGGDVGGDVQVTDAVDRRWHRKMGDGTYQIITCNFYGASTDVNYDHARPAEGAVYVVQRSTEYVVTTNLDDPGSGEVESDYRYTDIGEPSPAVPTMEQVKAARDAAVVPSWEDRG